MSMPITLISGWLGSGKTSVLGAVYSHCTPIERPGILIREFVANDFDRTRLPDTLGAIKIVDGDIGRVDLTFDAINELIDRAPITELAVEVVDFYEANEVAKALMPGGSLAEKAHLTMCITIVDASTFDYHIEHERARLTAQLIGADRIVLNKSDGVPPEDRDALKERVEAINPEADVEFAYMGQVKRRFVAEAPEDYTPRLQREDVHIDLLDRLDPLIFESHEICFDRVSFGHYLLNLPVVRFKGTLRSHNRSWGLTGVPGQLDWDPVIDTGPTRVVMLGPALDSQREEMITALHAEVERIKHWVIGD